MHKLGSMQDWPLRIEQLINHAEREHGDREIVSARADGIVRTNWVEIAHDARRMAQALERLGVGKGDRVATLAMNHSRHLAAWFGATGVGGVIHTLNPRLFDDQLVYVINHAEDRVLIYDALFAPVVERLKPRLETVLDFIEFESEFDGWIGAEDGDYRWAAGDERDPCGLCYTSGTTGNPKGVLYEHRSTLLHAMSIALPDLFDLSARSVILPVTPMFHANAWCLPYAVALTGCKLVLSSDNRPDRLCDLFRSEKVTGSTGVPTVWLTMIEHIEQTGAEFPHLKQIGCGGSAAPAAMIRWFADRGVNFMHLWGMTEMSPVGTIGSYPSNWDEMSVDEQIDYKCRQGSSMFGVELRTVDDDGNLLPRDGVSAGRLHTRGAAVVKRYFKHDEDSVDKDQWFDTGDVGVIHPDGSLQLTDRAKDVIKSGGEWISSIELENAAIGCDGVAEAAAIGIPHPKWDERPLLVVVRSDECHVDAETIRQHLSGQVAKWWLPDAIEFVDELPHTGTGKISKKELRDRFRDYRFATTDARMEELRR